METKTCVSCLEARPLTEFYRRSDSPDGLHNICKSCKRVHQSWYYRTKSLGVKRNHYKDKGLNLEEWLELRDRKRGAPCEICGEIGNLVADHDHNRSKFRGLICGRCNSGLGFFRDDIENIRSAERYLLAFEEKVNTPL